MAHWHAEKYDTLCQRNYSINGHEDSFEFLPAYIKEYITDVTLVMQKPVFEFANGFKLVQECIEVDGQNAWRSTMTLGDFVFFDIPDCSFREFFPDCKRFSTVLGAFLAIPFDTAEAWVKTLQNSKRKTWKTGPEVLASEKFKKVFEKAIIESAINSMPIPMLLPTISDEVIAYKSVDKIKYVIKFVFGVEVKSYKYKDGYFVDPGNKKPFVIEDIDSLDAYLRAKYEEYKFSHPVTLNTEEKNSEESEIAARNASENTTVSSSQSVADDTIIEIASPDDSAELNETPVEQASTSITKPKRKSRAKTVTASEEKKPPKKTVNKTQKNQDSATEDKPARVKRTKDNTKQKPKTIAEAKKSRPQKKANSKDVVKNSKTKAQKAAKEKPQKTTKKINKTTKENTKKRTKKSGDDTDVTKKKAVKSKLDKPKRQTAKKAGPIDRSKRKS